MCIYIYIYIYICSAGSVVAVALGRRHPTGLKSVAAFALGRDSVGWVFIMF